MFKIIASGNTFTGNLKNFEMEGEDLVVSFVLNPEKSITVMFPNFPRPMYEAMHRTGKDALNKNGVVDVNSRRVDRGSALEPDPNRPKVAVDTRPGSSGTIKGGLVG